MTLHQMANPKNMFYDGPRIYSYGRHFLIARLLEVNNNLSVLFTRREYSVSTSTHKRKALSAVNHLPIYFVIDPSVPPSRADWESHVADAAEHAAKAKRARVAHMIDWHMSRAQHAADEANKLNDAFSLGLPPVTLESLGVLVADAAARIAEARRLEADARAKREAERFAREAEQRSEWLAGRGYWHGLSPAGGAFLRVNGNELETSQGARVPLDHAVKAFRFVKLCREQGREWVRNGHSLRVGAFTVDRIFANGDFRAGCHFIEWNECARIAGDLGLFDVTADASALELTAAH